MIIACALPLLLIFILPLFGVGSGIYLFIFLALCFVLHLLMMGGHHGGHNNHDDRKESGHGTH